MYDEENLVHEEMHEVCSRSKVRRGILKRAISDYQRSGGRWTSLVATEEERVFLAV